ncbi:hypothetical protein EXW62_16085 [Bacillus mycoides]|uniref:hypothetical protein n=1 Tax=Bacillus mycoides TaxID=1405 RepID=UPI001C011544|nr:hypothetical protein [Bacillus mycoides]QWH18512.1 hypothetical protein EXW62_16085 [Bacillus mycoides]
MDGKDIRTYNIGNLVIHNTIGIGFFTNSCNGPTIIFDVYFYSNGQSISECPIHKLSEQEKMELVFNTLKRFTYEGKVKRFTVRGIETIFK